MGRGRRDKRRRKHRKHAKRKKWSGPRSRGGCPEHLRARGRETRDFRTRWASMRGRGGAQIGFAFEGDGMPVDVDGPDAPELLRRGRLGQLLGELDDEAPEG